ncbi:MAG: hypothetical protein ABW185_07795, partial [Sedimenticola sp.]
SENVDSEPVPALHTLPDNSENEDSDADTELLNVSTESLCHVRKAVHRIYSSDEETEGEAGLSHADIRGKQRVSRRRLPAPRQRSPETVDPYCPSDEETYAGARDKQPVSRPAPRPCPSSDYSDAGNTTVIPRRVLRFQAPLAEPVAGCSKWTDGPARREAPRTVRIPATESDSSTDVEATNVRGGQIGYKAGTKGALEKAGWYKVPDSFKLSAPFVAFRNKLESNFKNDRVMNNTSFNVIRMAYYMGGRHHTYTDKCLNEDAYNGMNTMLLKEGGCKYQKLYNYNKSLKLFVKFELKRAKKENRKADRSRLKEMATELCEKGSHLERESKRESRVARARAPAVPTPYEVTDVLRVTSGRFAKLMNAAKSGTVLNRDQVCFVNRYIGSYIMLHQAHRPGVLENLTCDLVLKGINANKEVLHGKSYSAITVIEHKTARQFTARIVLDDQLLNVFETYHRYVRQAIVNATNSTTEGFFLQNDGSRFTKFSEAPVKLQQWAKLPTTYTSACARKSYETYNQFMSEKLQKDMAGFMCHSERTRDSDYRQAGLLASINVVANYKHMVAFYRNRGTNVYPDEISSQQGTQGNPSQEENEHTHRHQSQMRHLPLAEHQGSVVVSGRQFQRVQSLQRYTSRWLCGLLPRGKVRKWSDKK